jgi:hypothetical protein
MFHDSSSCCHASHVWQQRSALQHDRQSSLSSSARAETKQRGIAFAASALEEDDTYGGALADYVDDVGPGVGLGTGFGREVVSSDDDDADPRATLHAGPARLGGAAAAPLLRARQGTMGNDSFVQGFVRADVETAAPSEVPETPIARGAGPPRQHRFATPCSQWYGAQRAGAGLSGTGPVMAEADVPPPTDAELRLRIDQMAALVARSGAEMYQFARSMHVGATFWLTLCAKL